MRTESINEKTTQLKLESTAGATVNARVVEALEDLNATKADKSQLEGLQDQIDELNIEIQNTDQWESIDW